MFHQVKGPGFTVGNTVEAKRLQNGSIVWDNATVLTDCRNGYHEIKFLNDGIRAKATPDDMRPSKEDRTQIGIETYNITKASPNTWESVLNPNQRNFTHHKNYKNQRVICDQITSHTFALHKMLQDIVLRELRPIHASVCGLDVSTIADSAQTHATRAQEKAAVVDNIVLGLQSATEISSQAQPILDQLNVISRKLSELENNHRQLENNQRQLSKDLAKTQSDQSDQFAQIDNRLSRIEASAADAKCSCTII